MINRIRVTFSLMLLLGFCIQLSAQGSSHQWTKHNAKKWYNQKEWLSGLNLKAHKSTNKLEFAKQYHANKSYWDEAFAYLKAHDLNALAPGKYPIDGDNVFATVTYSKTKPFDSTQWESHRKYIDLQYVINGEEKIGVAPVAKAAVTRAYDAGRDAANYSVKGKLYKAKPGTFFLFFPSDAHRPNITTGGDKPDKKIVIKIKAA
jgi:biofilm protein TabA